MPGPGSNNTKDSNIVETMTCIVKFVDVIILLGPRGDEHVVVGRWQ